MIHGVIFRRVDNQPLLPHVMQATSVYERVRGLLGRPPLKENEGLLINHCSSIHTVGMHYPIDTIFITKDWRIKKIFHNVKPWRFAMSFNAGMVLEIVAGTARRLELNENMSLYWEPTL